MLISRSYAKRLVRQGKAVEDGSCHHDGQRYQIVDRLDLQRVDHYPLYSGQPTRVQVDGKRTLASQVDGGWGEISAQT